MKSNVISRKVYLVSDTDEILSLMNSIAYEGWKKINKYTIRFNKGNKRNNIKSILGEQKRQE